MTARITVVGLGPGDAGLVTTATLEAIARIPRRFLRTRHHPSAFLVQDVISFDGHYEAADTFDDVYVRIVSDLLAAATGTSDDEILYAVPGSPKVLERRSSCWSKRLLLDRSRCRSSVRCRSSISRGPVWASTRSPTVFA